MDAQEALARVRELVDKVPADPQAAAHGYGHLLRWRDVNQVLERVAREAEAERV